MPITVLDIVEHKVGKKNTYTGQDCADAGVFPLGGCCRCTATISILNACPTRSGYWMCKDCVEPIEGFTTVQEFHEFTKRMVALDDGHLESAYEDRYRED